MPRRASPVRYRILDARRYDRELRKVLDQFFLGILSPTNIDQPPFFTVSQTLGVRDVVHGQAFELERYHTRRFERTMRRFGVRPVASNPSIVSYLNEWSVENERLIRTVHTRAAERIQEAVASTRDRQELRRALRKEWRTARWNLRRISLNETINATARMTRERHREVGIRRFQWSSVGDRRVRPAHEELDSQIFNWDRPPSEGYPGEPVLCRCVAIPVMSLAPNERAS